MAKSGLTHIDVGPELTRTEWESEDTHALINGAAFPGAPVERQLFYRNDLHEWYIYDGTAWVNLQGDAAHAAEEAAPVHGSTALATADKLVHRDAQGRARVVDPDVDADIDTRGARNTAIEDHRTGATHALDQPPASHDNAKHSTNFATQADHLAHGDRHQWLAADEANIKDQIMEPNNLYRVVDLSTFNGMTETVAGSGSTAAWWTTWRFVTGATQNSVACQRSNLGDWINHGDPAWRWRVFFRMNPRSHATGHKFFAGWLASISYPIDLTTQNHVCFELDTDGKIYACAGDGTNYHRIDTGVTISANGSYDCYYKYMASDIRFYINKSLVATVSTYRPTSTAPRLVFHQSNPTVAADRQVWVYAVRTLGGAE